MVLSTILIFILKVNEALRKHDSNQGLTVRIVQGDVSHVTNA